MLEQNMLHVYTDGSSLSKPRRGGYAARFVYLDDAFNEQTENFEYRGVPGATNNQMELRGCIAGVKEISGFNSLSSINRIIVLTDSMYVVKYHPYAMGSWRANRWIGRNGPIKNVELWKELVRELLKVKKNISISWVKGHSKDLHNKAVDVMARKAAQNCIGKLIHGVTVRSKRFKNDANPIVIKHCGQKFTIKIFTCIYLRQHKLYEYKFEVISPKSCYYKCSGTTYYTEPLRTRYSYLVTLSNSENDRRICIIHRVYGKK